MKILNVLMTVVGAVERKGVPEPFQEPFRKVIKLPSTHNLKITPVNKLNHAKSYKHYIRVSNDGTSCNKFLVN